MPPKRFWEGSDMVERWQSVSSRRGKIRAISWELQEVRDSLNLCQWYWEYSSPLVRYR